MNHPIKGYDETFVTYILAAASPTFPIDKKVYDDCWVNRKEGEFFCATDFYGIMLPLGKRAQMGGPLFWVHYSYTGLDPRGWPTGLQTTGNRTAAIRWSTAPTASTTRTVGWDTAPISGA